MVRRNITTTLQIALAVVLALVTLRVAAQYDARTGRIFTNPDMAGVSASIGGSLLIAGACNTTTVSVPSATTSMAVVVSPSGGVSVGVGVTWFGEVTSAGTVTVSECAIVAATPTSSTFQVRVIQ